MKKILAIAAVAALSAGVSAYAANPFSDVTPSDWAYQAVVDLSDQGVVEGYPDGTFKGERNITRYEMAQIIARMLAKEDQLNAEQRATLDKLAGEYADELANLGVRVANLEKKVGNIAWSGNARMRFVQDYDPGLVCCYGVYIRIFAGKRNPAVHDLYYYVNQCQAALKKLFGLLHVSRVPVYMHSFFHFILLSPPEGISCADILDSLLKKELKVQFLFVRYYS